MTLIHFIQQALDASAKSIENTLALLDEACTIPFTSIEQAVAMVETFLATAFEGGRHANRVNKIACS